MVPYLDPLPRFEISQPGNILRIFERGGRFRPEVGIPERARRTGPAARAGSASAAWAPRTAPTRSSSACSKTRLLDPTLNFLGTNDHPGDYRSSGCTACHVIYANDRSPVHSGPYAEVRQPRADAATPIRRSPRTSRAIRSSTGSPRGIPTSQCIVCHVHPGTNVHEQLPRLHVVGRGNRRRADVPARSRSIRPPRSSSRPQMSNPDEAAGARALVRSRVPANASPS